MSSLDEQLATVVKEHGKARIGTLKNFNTILMKFTKIEAGFEQVRSVFKEMDDDSSNTIEMEEMKGACKKLGLNFTDEKVEEIFDKADMDHNKHISFREFIVALSMLYLLSESPVVGDQNLFVDAIEVVIDAFMFFDKDANGSIQHDEVMTAMAGNAGTDQIEKRFKEMDLNNTGNITFVNFLYVFEEWVGMEDEDEEEGAEGAEGAN